MNNNISSNDVGRHRTAIDPDAPPRTIEQQVDARRAELDQTLRQLEERFDPNRMIDYVKDNGGEIAGNLGRTFKQNPVPFVLTGIGLAWLMSAQSTANRQPNYPAYRSSRYDGNPYDEEDALYAAEVIEEAYDRQRDRPSGSRYDTSAYAAAVQDDEGRGPIDKARDAMSGFGEDVSDGIDALGDRLTHARESGSDSARRFASDVSERQAALRDAAAERYSAMSDDARARYDRARRAGHDAARRASRHAHSASRRAAGFLEEQPLVAGSVGVAVGALIGVLLPPSRTEDRYFGERADAIRGEVIDTASEHAGRARERLEDQAHDAIRTGRQAAEDALESGRELGEQAIRKADERADDKASA